MRTEEAVSRFLSSRRAKALSPTTIKWYRGILFLFQSQFKKLPKKPEYVEEFLYSLETGDERRHGYYRAIKCFYRFLEKRRLTKNPMAFVEAPRVKQKEPDILMPEDINIVLNHPHKPKIRAALLFLADSGPRLAEVAGLNVIDLNETPWGFTASVRGKTGTRTVPISYETYHALMVSLPFGWSKDWLGRQISQACREAGVRASALTFRHTFATLWSGDELVLQQIMGHTTLTTTKRYRHLRTQLLSQQHSQYSPLKMVLASSKSML